MQRWLSKTELIREAERQSSCTGFAYYENFENNITIWQQKLYIEVGLMPWYVRFSRKAAKQVCELPANIQDQLKALLLEIRVTGPVRGNWPNYSKLGPDEHHCHLAYRYVACWRVDDYEIQIVEVYYAGSREKAPY